MNLIKSIKSKYRRWERQKTIKILTTTDPEKIEAYGEKLLIKAFHRAAERVPFYKNFLSQKGINPKKIKDLGSFQRNVPFLDKEIIFPNNDLEDICINGKLKDIKTFYTSSGYSGIFSIGVETEKSISDSANMIDFLLDYQLQASDKKTLLINCLPMGIKINSALVKVAETGVRYDAALALTKKLARSFDQIIIVGENLLLKELVEEGLEQGIDWKKMVVHLITGGEFIAENWRSYLAHLLGIDFEQPEKGLIAINMGLSELSLSIFQENPSTIKIRRQLLKNQDFRRALIKTREDNYPIPMVMQYSPQNVFLETEVQPDGREELFVTTVSDVKMPLIRYQTGDFVRLLSYKKMDEFLTQFNLNHLRPPFSFPFGLIYGRFRGITLKDNLEIYPEMVKEALFSDYNLVSCITGNFKLKAVSDHVLIEIQLRKGVKDTPELASDFMKALSIYVKSKFQIKLFPYYQFPYSMEVDYERKFRHID